MVESVKAAWEMLSNTMSVISSLLIIVWFFWGWLPRTIKLSCGTLRMYNKDINASSLTNAVSTAFFGGGQLPPAVRQEVIKVTNPPVWGIEATATTPPAGDAKPKA